MVPMAVVHTRPIQLMLHDQWTQVSDSPYVRIYLNEATLAELEWWTSQANLQVGRPFLHPDPTMSIVTDASKEGWGGHLGDWVVSGHWSRAWAKRHINWLELQAVWLTLKHFLPQLQGTAVDVISDNSTTVAYISTRWAGPSPRLCAFWHWTSGHGAGNTTSFLWPATCPGTRTSLRMPCPGGATVTRRSGPSTTR